MTGVSRSCGVKAALLALFMGACSDGASEPQVDESPQAETATFEFPDWNPEPDPDLPVRKRLRSPGRFRKRARSTATDLTPEQQAMVQKLESIGYAAGSSDAPDAEGVILNRTERAQPGLNFYVSGHAPEAILIDMDGNVVHRWHRRFLDSFPDQRRVTPNVHYWRRALPLDNGDLIAIHSGHGIVKLDRNSNLIWARPHPVHHDLHIMPSGEIFVLTRRAQVVPRVHDKLPILEDFVALLDPEGGLLKEVSLLEAYENAAGGRSWIDLSRRFWEREKQRRLAVPRTEMALDIFHTNSIEPVDRRAAGLIPGVSEGNVLLSFCHLDTIAVVDLDTPAVVWALEEELRLQHDPSAQEDGSILVFDNFWQPNRSRVVAFDPNTGETVWEYYGSADRPFFSRTCGAAQRLDNGNILVTESDGGRAFEVTPQKEIAWEFLSPHRAGENGEYIATLFELRRLPADFGKSWLDRKRSSR